MNTSLRIWITGASSGIGQACALKLAGAGHQVWAAARSTDKLQSLAAQAADLPGDIEVHECDVTDPASVSACALAMSETWGGMDVVIPNAGIGYFNPLTEAPLEEWHAMVDVNVTGVLTTVHAA